MLVIIGVLMYISASISADVNSTNTSYVLATVLFYKDIKGNIRIASGPVPQKANVAIMNDISFRMSDVTVKVVSVFNESQEMPQTVNIYKLIKNQQKPVYVTEVHKRLSRNIKDWWSNLWGLNVRTHKKKQVVKYNDGKDSTVTSQVPQTTKTLDKNQASRNVTSTASPVYASKGGELITKILATAPKKKIKTTTPTQDVKSLEYSDNYIPNDIYYSIEKKCVNWSDRCNLQSGNFLNMTSQSFYYVYKRPNIVKYGPTLD